MAIQVTVPALGESITQATIVKWHKQDGDRVLRGEALCELETDKADVDVPSPDAGVLYRLRNEGDVVAIGELIAEVMASESAATPQPAATPPIPSATRPAGSSEPATSLPAVPALLSPAVRRLVTENDLNPAEIPPTGKEGRLTKEDVLSHMEAQHAERSSDVVPFHGPTPLPPPPPAPVPSARVITPQPTPAAPAADGIRREPMSRIRKKIAERLVAAQHTAAILTTFNEIDMSAVQDLRARYRDRFNELHGIGLGLMSFFVRAAVLALHEFPRVNASIEGDDVVFHDYVHLGIAVSTDRGLAVPVLRNAQAMSFADIESEIKRLATAARDGKLAVDELSGGTFTITNGGVFGSLLSTPILNPPQSAILGMHTIQKRPIAVDDRVAIHPMMYVALSYDHRLIDGRESVSFLVRLKQLVEDPTRLMLEV